MTAAQLIRLLQTLPPETLICMSSDPEGNSFSQMEMGGATGYLYDGNYYSEEDVVKWEDCKHIKNDGLYAFFLWPME